MTRQFPATPEEKAAACTSLEELEGFISAARDRGDPETEQAGVTRRAELLRAAGPKRKRS